MAAIKGQGSAHLFIFLSLHSTSQTTSNRPPHMFQPSRVSSPMHPLKGEANFWLVVVFPHRLAMYTKCFSTSICYGWAYGCALTLLCLCRSGVDFRKIGLSPSPSDVVMSWLSLHFSTCAGGGGFLEDRGHGWVLVMFSDIVRSWLRLQSPIDCIPHPYHVHTIICCE
jgi:hypothetical protein